MKKGDNEIFTLMDGKMTQVGTPRKAEDLLNFVIVCEHGDWSGFRTLPDCVKQFRELEANGRPNYYYSVVERI